MMSGQGFVHLHTHSFHSIGEGVLSPERLVARAGELGMRTIALTDRNSLAGVPHFVRVAKEKSVKPIVGCELDFLPTDQQRAEQGRLHSLVLLVENEDGYRNLVRLVTLAWRQSREGRGIGATLDELAQHSEGLIVLTSGRRGELFHLLTGEDVDATEKYLGQLLSIFGGRLFLEMVLLRDARSELINAKIHRIGKLIKIRAVATEDVYYFSPEDELCARFLRGEPYHAATALRSSAGTAIQSGYFVSGRDLFREFPQYSEEIEATEEVASRCNFALWEARNYFPHRDFSRGQDAESVLWDAVTQRASEGFAEPGTERGGVEAEVKERLNTEFDAVKKERFADALIFLADTARFLTKQQILYGVGEDNVAASLIAYLLGIIEMNPVKYRLLFESFRLNGEAPLFSLKVAPVCVESVVNYWRDACGKESVAQIGEPIYSSVEELEEAILEWSGISPQQENGPDDVADAMIRTLRECPRGMQMRGGRYVVSGKSLLDVCPLMEREAGASMTHYCADDLCQLGLPSVEIVPDRMLGIVFETLRIAGERGENQSAFSAEEVISNAALYQAAGRGEVKGVPVLESPAVVALLNQRKPRNILQLVRVLADAERRVCEGAEEEEKKGKEHSVSSRIEQAVNALRVLKVRLEHRQAFFAAVLSSLRTGSRMFASQIAEIRRNRITMLPVDVNFSSFDFSLEEHGIRTGLRIVRGVMSEVYREIERTRVSGAFHDPEDFCSRVDNNIVTPRAVRNLIKAGAFDSVGASRVELLRRYDAGRGFGSPTAPEQETNLLDKRNIALEEEAAGCVFSVDAAAVFRDALKRMKVGYGKSALRKPTTRLQWVAGFVGTIERRCAFVGEGIRLLAEVGGVLVKVPEEVCRRDGRIIFSSRLIIVGGTTDVIDGATFLVAVGFWDVEKVEAEFHDVEKIVFDLRGRDSEFVKRLRHVVREYPGKTTIEVSEYEEEAVRQVERLEDRKVLYCPPLVEELKLLVEPGAMTVVKKVAQGQSLL